MTKLSYLHFDARSRKITRADILEVFAEETSRGISDELKTKYLAAVMSSG